MAGAEVGERVEVERIVEGKWLVCEVLEVEELVERDVEERDVDEVDAEESSLGSAIVLDVSEGSGTGMGTGTMADGSGSGTGTGPGTTEGSSEPVST